MIARIDLRGSTEDPRDLLPRAELAVEGALDVVRPICAAVRDRGSAALVEYAERFDGVRPTRIRVPAAALTRALDELDSGVRDALETCVRRARVVHRDQRRTDITTQVAPGGTVTERWVPVQRVGLYVPGGQAVYPSSVVMNVVPAQEAAVPSMAVASPPRPGPEGAWHTGLPHPTILATCALLGIDEVYAAGGAQAIAMFAYGTAECPPVAMVTGPGNIYVAAAKRLLKGRIGIDAEAGPTEIAILADQYADPALVAADLISQAEHDTMAAAVLVTDSVELADAVQSQLHRQVAVARHRERIMAALSGRQSGVVLVDSVTHGLAVVNAYAAEHLEILTEDAAAVAARVRNAGAVFVGPFAPVSLGDYAAGSNHVLPTGGCACHSGGLSVQSFLRGVHVVEYTRDALAEVAGHVVTLAEAENLPAHGTAVTARLAPKVPAAGPVGQPTPQPGGHHDSRAVRGSFASERARSVKQTRREPGSVDWAGLPVRDELREQSPYAAPQLDVPVRLNTNENPYALPRELVARIAERVAEAARTLNRYPDRDAVELRTELAGYLTRTTGHPLTFDQVWAANGSNEVIQQLLQVFGGPGRTALGFEPSYSMHALISRGTGTTWIAGPRGDDFSLDAERAGQLIAETAPDVVFLCSPNNPTGTAVDAGTVLDLYTAVCASGNGRGDTPLLVVDEAYVEFSHRASLLPLIEGRRNLVVCRTMSKAFGAAGLRVGYLAADPLVIDAVQLVRLPYHLSAVTQATALAALEHTDTLLGYVEQLKAERDRLVSELRTLGLQVCASDANFVQFGRFRDSRQMWQGLLDHGVLVRDNHVPGWLRVTAGTPAENDAFLAAVRQLLSTPGRIDRVPGPRGTGGG